MRNALNLEVMLAPPPRPWTLKPVQTLTPCHRRPQARASLPVEALEPHHETLGVELEVALQDLVDFRIAERAAVAVHQIEPQSAHRGADAGGRFRILRSEEHTSELQSQSNPVCRLLLEKKKNNRMSIND